MFKYMLYRAMRTGIFVFNTGEAPHLDQCKREMNNYNAKADLLWKSGGRFSERRRTCENLLGMTAPSLKHLNHVVLEDDLRRFPSSIENELNLIFQRHYDTEEKYMLLGRADNKAYKVQDGYAMEVAKLLEKIDDEYSLRAQLCLRKIYGRGAPLPLLSSASVEAMWEVCKSEYYKRQISLVSGTRRQL